LRRWLVHGECMTAEVVGPTARSLRLIAVLRRFAYGFPGRWDFLTMWARIGDT
jgi:hypothetical protein